MERASRVSRRTGGGSKTETARSLEELGFFGAATISVGVRNGFGFACSTADWRRAEAQQKRKESEREMCGWGIRVRKIGEMKEGVCLLVIFDR